MLKTLKRGVLKAGKASGAFFVAREMWAQKLLILCYHGISLADEHEWNAGLYMDPATFRRRMEMLRSYRVLPLGEALELMDRGRLPARSVVITFDDGSYDFYAQAMPILRDFGYPVTLYLSTYYCQRQAPVFDTACSYMLWKSIGKSLDTAGFLPEGGEVRIEDMTSQRRLYYSLWRHFQRVRPDPDEKDEILRELARRLGFDLDSILNRRILFYMNPEEVAAVAREGVDIELHTHRHRTPRDRRLFLREIEDNVRAIQELTGRSERPRHFCYPSGDFAPEFYGWLREAGVESAVTCELALASRTANRMELPRLVDMPTIQELELEGWLTGFSAVFPQQDWRAKQNPYSQSTI